MHNYLRRPPAPRRPGLLRMLTPGWVSRVPAEHLVASAWSTPERGTRGIGALLRDPCPVRTHLGNRSLTAACFLEICIDDRRSGAVRRPRDVDLHAMSRREFGLMPALVRG